MSTLDDLTAASNELRDLDARRKDQQRYRDGLIAAAKAEGVGWADIKRATGMQDRSLALALRRISSS